MKLYPFMLPYSIPPKRGILFIWVCVFMSYAHFASGQYYILGRVLDDEEIPYAHAAASLRGEDYASEQICSELGVFRFENLASGSYELVLITAYGIRRKKIELRGSIDITLHIARNIEIDEISVVANKAGSKEPVTHSNLSALEVQQKDFAQDMPYILEGTPSLVATSDAGHGIGYTGLRIRGTDPTRINVTLNGIPVNDAESHNVFWVDLPDLASSTTSIQVQRGLGWSQPGTGDLGGSIQLNTLGFRHEPYGNLKLGAGSFDTRRVSVSGGTGLLRGRFTADGRLSYIGSNGYIDRAKNTLYSVYTTAGYHHDQTNIKLLYALGDELTYQAWNGVPEQYINDPILRTYNSAGAEKPDIPHDNEVDDYRQQHVQLHFDQALTPFTRWTNAIHYTHGAGFFEQYKSGQDLAEYGISETSLLSDLIRRRWLDNDFYGFISTLQIGSPGDRYLVLGGGWNHYQGEHFGEVIWTEANISLEEIPPYYHNDASKKDWNVFIRSSTEISKRIDMTIDVQGRWIRYAFEGPDLQGQLTDQVVRHRFFNPKIGFKFSVSESATLYGLTGVIRKEPNRDDYVESTPLSRPKAERLWDTELGYRLQLDRLSFEMTGYAMVYKDQLVLTGRLNDVGAYTRVNVDRSHRKGIETTLAFSPIGKIKLEAQATLSDNKIKSFQEFIDNWTTGEQEIVSHGKTNIAFSPSVLTSLNGRYTLVSNAKHEISVNVGGRYVGKQYVDNTSREASALDAYLPVDAGFSWTWYNGWTKGIELKFLVRNIFDRGYESNGWIYRFQSPDYNPVPDDPYAGSEGGDLYHLKGYFPQAGRHVLVQLGFNF